MEIDKDGNNQLVSVKKCFNPNGVGVADDDVWFQIPLHHESVFYVVHQQVRFSV